VDIGASKSYGLSHQMFDPIPDHGFSILIHWMHQPPLPLNLGILDISAIQTTAHPQSALAES
jgi:hypothetical protein